MQKGVSSKSARGSCGFSVQELKSIPVSMLQALFDLFHALEAGAAWPEALVFALVVCLPKTDGACTAFQIRPITILNRLHRCWARYRSTEIVKLLSSRLPPTIAGGFFPSHLVRTSPHCRDEFGTEALLRSDSPSSLEDARASRPINRSPFGVLEYKVQGTQISMPDDFTSTLKRTAKLRDTASPEGQLHQHKAASGYFGLA